MRSRMLLLILAILFVAGFAWLNMPEIMRSSPLNFGLFVMDAPLGLILLSLLTVGLVLFLTMGAAYRTQTLLESRQHMKEMHVQRELADKAEASRFTELRTHLDTQLRELRQRDAITITELEKTLVANQREMRTQLEQMNRTLAARLNEIEHRFDGRPTAGTGPVAHTAALDDHQRQEHAMAQQREMQRREERLHEERVQHERAEAATDRPHAGIERTDDRNPAGRPTEQSGWRRWF